jgi:hypothetical protein
LFSSEFADIFSEKFMCSMNGLNFKFTCGSRREVTSEEALVKSNMLGLPGWGS